MKMYERDLLLLADLSLGLLLRQRHNQGAIQPGGHHNGGVPNRRDIIHPSHVARTRQRLHCDNTPLAGP